MVSDLSSQTPEQLAEKVRTAFGGPTPLAELDERYMARVALSELVRRLEAAEDTADTESKRADAHKTRARQFRAERDTLKAALEQIADIEVDGVRIALADDDPGERAEYAMTRIAREALSARTDEA